LTFYSKCIIVASTIFEFSLTKGETLENTNEAPRDTHTHERVPNSAYGIYSQSLGNCPINGHMKIQWHIGGFKNATYYSFAGNSELLMMSNTLFSCEHQLFERRSDGSWHGWRVRLRPDQNAYTVMFVHGAIAIPVDDKAMKLIAEGKKRAQKISLPPPKNRNQNFVTVA